MTPETFSPTDPFWEHHRGLYPALGRYTYLNNASIQPLPTPVAAALHDFIRAATEGDPDALYRPEVPSRLRATFARWLGCGAKDLDTDGDVDQEDFGLLQACLTGMNVPADPGCLNR